MAGPGPAFEPGRPSAPVSLFTPAGAATTALHPNVVERLLAVRERADALHRAVVPHSEWSEANMAKIAAANRQRQLEAPPPEGYNLHPEDRRLLAQREQVEQLTVEWQRLEAQNERAVAAWQPAARVRSVCEEFLRDRPPTAVEVAPTEPPKLAKGESLLDAIERIRHRGRELLADANRISSSPYPSSWAQAQVRAQVAAIAQRGAPDVTLLVEHVGTASLGRCKTCNRRSTTPTALPLGSLRLTRSPCSRGHSGISWSPRWTARLTKRPMTSTHWTTASAKSARPKCWPIC
jgi:hypothetical protein